MLYLIGGIVLSSFLILALKYGERYGIDRLQTIIFNYITCVVTGFIFHPCICYFASIISSSWWPYSALLGSMFFISFNLMAYTTRHAGITAVSMASKLSMVIPIIAAFLIYKDQITILKMAGIAIAICSIVILSYQDKNKARFSKVTIVVTWLVFLITGLNDSMVKWVQSGKVLPADFELFNTSVFMFAAVAGSLTLLWQWLIMILEIKRKNIIAGVAIGIPNYFSLLCLIFALHQPGWQSSMVFPINNIGIILFSVSMGVLFLKEHITKRKAWGLLLAVASIILLSWGRL